MQTKNNKKLHHGEKTNTCCLILHVYKLNTLTKKDNKRMLPTKAIFDNDGWLLTIKTWNVINLFT